ncbi:MAG: hypothetical protein DSY80_04270 [Desulfocapsa sp.]|nr:MAG: hypothetical protein DSY80_04270 [Desulfocapsa sp.]
MIPIDEYKSVPIYNITFSGDWNLQPFASQQTSTASHTIRLSAILHPPVVKKTAGSETEYELLCGGDRLQSFRKHFPDKKNITVLLLPENSQQTDILQYLLADKRLSSTFSPMEKAFFLQICSGLMPEDAVIKNFLPLLDEKSQPYVLHRYHLLTTLEPGIQEDIHTGILSPKLGLHLLSLSAENRLKLHELFQYLELGGGKQKQLFSLCRELSIRESITFTALFENEEFAAILHHEEMNIPQKGSSLLNLLQKRLYPEWNKAENNFRKTVGQMQLPAKWNVKHSPAFERDEVLMTIAFKNLDQLQQKVQAMKEVLS